MPRQSTSPSPPPPPPLSAFSFWTGNFDYPRATEHRPTSSYIASRNPDRLRRPPRIPSDWRAEDDDTMPVEPPGRFRSGRTPIPNALLLTDDEDGQPHMGTGSSVPSSSNNRPRIAPGMRSLQRSNARARTVARLRAREMGVSVDELTSSRIPASISYLEGYLNPAAISRPRRTTDPEPANRQTRQAKRRKLNHDAPTDPYDGFRYGYNGQVVSGRLNMEIVSCDGGEYERDSSRRLYPITNVLKNDTSVYCSERSHCNLLLRHIGEMPFTLEKVVIRAPDRGFTAPVQQGLLFVRMTDENLISGTAAYDLDYGTPPPALRRSSSRPSRPGSSGDNDLLSFAEALNDPYLSEHLREARISADLSADMEDRISELRQLRQDRANRQLPRSWGDFLTPPSPLRSETQLTVPTEYCDDPDMDDMAEDAMYGNAPRRRVSAPTPPPFITPPFTISTGTDDEDDPDDGEDSETESPSAAMLADRLRRESRFRGDSDDGEGEDYDENISLARRVYNIDPRDAGRLWRAERSERIRSRRRATPCRIAINGADVDRSRGRRGPPRDEVEGEDLIQYNADFFMTKTQNRVTVRFPHGISGRFILLKLWSPTQNGNIDIESVQFYGYSGPRFFPATQMR